MILTAFTLCSRIASMISPHKWRTSILAAIATASIRTRERSWLGIESYFFRKALISGSEEKRMALNASLRPLGVSFRMEVISGTFSSCCGVTFRRSRQDSLLVSPGRPGGRGALGDFLKDNLLFAESDPFFKRFVGCSERFEQFVFVAWGTSDSGVSDIGFDRILLIKFGRFEDTPGSKRFRNLLQSRSYPFHRLLVSRHLLFDVQS